MKVPVIEESYQGFSVTVFWMRPRTPGNLIYGYRSTDGDFEIWGTGFPTSGVACRAAAKVIDQLLEWTPASKRKGSRASGTNPRAMGVNPRALRGNKETEEALR